MRTISPCLGCIPILIVEWAIPKCQTTCGSRNEIGKLLRWFWNNDDRDSGTGGIRQTQLNPIMIEHLNLVFYTANG